MLSWSEEDKKKLFTALCPSRDGGESATAYFRFFFYVVPLADDGEFATAYFKWDRFLILFFYLQLSGSQISWTSCAVPARHLPPALF